MKLTATATKNLVTIWTTKVAYGVQGGLRVTTAQAKSAGYAGMNRNAASSLVTKGLARTLVTTDEILGHRVLVLVLTDAGRAAIGR